MTGTLYVMNDVGRLWWGSMLKSKANRIYDICWRPDHMELNRWYGNKHHLVRVTQCDGQHGEILYVYEAMSFENGNWVSAPVSVVNPKQCRTIHGYNDIKEKSWFSWVKHTAQFNCERNCIMNRMIEYQGAPIIPSSKYNSTFKQRWCEQLLLHA